MPDSTAVLARLFRNRLLDYVPVSGGPTLRTRLGGRLYDTVGPDTLDAASWPYAVFRIDVGQQTDGFLSFREDVSVEVQWYHRPRGQLAGDPEPRTTTLRALVDQADAAMLRWKDVSDGMIYARHRRRANVPPGPAPIDREVAQIVTVYELVVWPSYLSRIAS